MIKMDYRLRRPVAIAVGSDGTFAYPISVSSYSSPTEPYRRILNMVGSWVSGSPKLPNIFYMGYSAQRTAPKSKEKKGWVERNPKKPKGQNKSQITKKR